MDETQTTLRDSLESAIEQIEAAPEPTPVPRDESGRFAPRDSVKQDVTDAIEKPAEPVQEVVQEAVEPEKPVRQRPSTWKKDYWDSWEKLNRGEVLAQDEAGKLLDYLNQRENEYKTGVSTYKAEADRARELHQAIQPFMPELQRAGIQPTQWIQSLGAAHQTLVQGSPEQKLSMFAKLAQDYGVPLQALVQGEQGPVDQNYQWLASQVTTLQQAWQQQQIAEQQRQQQSMLSEIQQFASDGRHQYFDEVRETMAGLLQAGQADSLEKAYEKACRLHDNVWENIQAEKSRSVETQRTQQHQQAVSKAKAAAVSPRSGTAPAKATSGGNSLRETLAEQLESAMARV